MPFDIPSAAAMFTDVRDGRGFITPAWFRYLNQLATTGSGGTAGVPFWTVKDFGNAVGAGGDDTAAFQNALASEPFIFVPQGNYFVDNAAIQLQGGKLVGAGATACRIVCTQANAPCLKVNAGVNNAEYSGFTLDRNVPAVAGGNGIDVSAVTIGQSQFHSLQLRNHWDNLALGPTDYGQIYRIISELAYNDGFAQKNTATNGACQWYFSETLAQKCDGHAYSIISSAGPVHMTLGDYNAIRAFGCSGRGLLALGSAIPVEGLRVRVAFIGENGESGIYCDTYGGEVLLSDIFSELAGTANTGRTLATAPSGLGAGIEVTGNNGITQITSPDCPSNSLDGIYVAGAVQCIANVICKNNGVAGTAGRDAGINCAAGRTVINGGFLGNTGASVAQQYGLIVADGNNVSRNGVAYLNNTAGQNNVLANALGLSGVGNLPNTINVNISPAGAAIVGVPVGAFGGGAGTINVATGIALNNVPYANP